MAVKNKQVNFATSTVSQRRNETFQYTFRLSLQLLVQHFWITSLLLLISRRPDPQSEYDKFYSVAIELLNRFYPETIDTIYYLH